MDEVNRGSICKRLRSKMYYVVGRDHLDLAESSGTAQYWCARSVTVLGPDDILCCPEMCRPGRACFEAEEDVGPTSFSA